MQAGRRFRLCQKTPQLLWPVMTGQHLQPDNAVQRDLPRSIHHPHPTSAQLANDFVIANAPPRDERFGRGRRWMRRARMRHRR
jgi:hypothetical protein